MLDFADKVRNGAWRGFSGKRILNVINIGIGGSETGVRAVYHALVKGITIRLHFLSAADGIRLDRVLGQCDPRSTLVVVSSKTFTTRETLANARSVDAWFAKHGIVGERRHHHIVCVSANENAADLMGVPQSNLFLYWKSIGGRFSVWGAVGLPLAIVFGREVFTDFLRGAEEMDLHTRNAPIERNLAVMLALMSYRASENPKISSRCVLPYDERLREFIPWLQQLEMESLGKPADRDMSSRPAFLFGALAVTTVSTVFTNGCERELLARRLILLPAPSAATRMPNWRDHSTPMRWRSRRRCCIESLPFTTS